MASLEVLVTAENDVVRSAATEGKHVTLQEGEEEMEVDAGVVEMRVIKSSTIPSMSGGHGTLTGANTFKFC